MSTLTSLRIKGCYFAALVVCFAIIGLFAKGLNLGLDFTGGYLTEFTTSAPISQQSMQQNLVAMGFVDAKINSADNQQRWTLRLQDKPDQAMGAEQLNTLAHGLQTDVDLLDSVYIGSQVGTNLLEQGGLALLVAAIAILLYVSMRFEWRLALGALCALVHDVLIVLGIFAWLGLSFDLAVMAAILAIIGYSLNDSIVIGDRIRELLNMRQHTSLNDTINLAVKSTFTRTLITSGTTLVTISAIWILAGKPLAGFSIALFIGVVVGSLSSITLSATLPTIFGLDAYYYQRQKEVLEQHQ
ncbi:protein translocase subunit SecF [Glaciecola sp. SC05]|uniref:protein translocase subunit SecF n=1 Tax=Glaciecola sp. SC05 TaxID=1987355 RepID=UPI003527FCE5